MRNKRNLVLGIIGIISIIGIVSISIVFSSPEIKNRIISQIGETNEYKSGEEQSDDVNALSEVTSEMVATDVATTSGVWEKLDESTEFVTTNNVLNASATVTFQGTITNYDVNSDATGDMDDTAFLNMLEVHVNGEEVTEGITKTITSAEAVKSGSTQVGAKYTIKVEGFASDANQVKLVIPGRI